MNRKYIFVTGGVVSGLGTSSLQGVLCQDLVRE